MNCYNCKQKINMKVCAGLTTGEIFCTRSCLDEFKMKNLRKKFWVVWNPMNGNPTVAQDSYEKAAGEAERLSRKHPDQPFIVLESVYGLSTPSRPALNEWTYDE